MKYEMGAQIKILTSLFLVLILLTMSNLATAEDRFNLTEEEQEWINANPEVTVAMMKRFPPFSYLSQDEELKGFTVDLLNLLEDKLGLEFKFKTGFWADNLEKFKQGKVDMIQGISYREERAQYTLYTEPYYKVPLVIYIREDSDWYQSSKDLARRRVGVTENVFYRDVLRKDLKAKVVEKENNEEMMTALSFGELDAVITNLSIGEFYIQQNVLKNLRIMGEYSHPQVKKEDLRFGVQQSNPLLRRIMQKGLDAVSETEWTSLKSKWLGAAAEKIGTITLSDNLTPQEEAYLEDKEELRLAVSSNWMPFEKIDREREYKGVVAQFYDLVEDKLDIPIKIVSTSSWKEAAAKVKAGKADILSTAIKIRGSGLEFSHPYTKYPLVIATKREEAYINNLHAIGAKRVGLTQKCPFNEIIKDKYPEINFVEVEDIKTGLEKVAGGELFGLINTAPSIGYIIQQEHMFGLKISGELAQDLALRMGVEPDNEVLLSVLEKTLQSIERGKRERIFNDWLAIDYQRGFNYSLLFKVLLALLLIGLFLLYRQHQLQKFNEKLSSLNQELAQANQKLEDMSFIDGLTEIPNRRKFDEVLEKEWKHCQREGCPISLIMFDLDFFKQYNDRYGHLAGDDCLKQIAETITEQVNRPRDLVARYGGEEFIVILPETEEEGAKNLAHKMQEAIIDLEIEHQDSKVAPYVTASFGVATIIPHEELSSDDFVNGVDEALYQAKQNGRNRIEVQDFN